jgi:hypothetical protein
MIPPIEEWQSKPWKTWKGAIVNFPCECPMNLPGLGVIGCPCHRIWYVDETMMPEPDQDPSRPI